MAQTLIWSNETLEDVDRIAEYISKDPLPCADRRRASVRSCRRITRTPKLGHIVPELQDAHVRERFLYSYRLIYELSEHTIHVLAVIHGRRLLEADERFGP